MREFFQGWRRKAGLVTLVMACVLAAAWMRSAILADMIYMECGSVALFVRSSKGSLAWRLFTETTTGPLGSQWDTVRVADLDDESPRSLGIALNGRRGNVPYWSLVLPSTLLSAWLLLIKPRPTKSAKESSYA